MNHSLCGKIRLKQENKRKTAFIFANKLTQIPKNLIDSRIFVDCEAKFRTKFRKVPWTFNEKFRKAKRNFAAIKAIVFRNFVKNSPKFYLKLNFVHFRRKAPKSSEICRNSFALFLQLDLIRKIQRTNNEAFTIPFAIWKAKDWRSVESSAPSRLKARVREAAWAL